MKQARPEIASPIKLKHGVLSIDNIKKPQQQKTKSETINDSTFNP